MGIEYRTYVGPYVRCVVGTAEVEKSRRACLTQGCQNHQRDNAGRDSAFCSLCGSPIGLVPYTVVELAVDEWDVRDALNERLATPSGDGYSFWARDEYAHLWIPNVSTPGRDYSLDERADFALMEITPEQALEERAAFTVQFQPELTVLRATYGADAVSIHWGIIQDYS